MAKVSLSITKGRGSIAHNNREFSTPNVDSEFSKNNIIYKQESLEEAYQVCFGEALEQYNAKQKRKDRKIAGVSGYLEKIRSSGNGEKLFYEVVVQVGNQYDCPTGTDNADLATQALDDYMKSWEQRNPNLYVVNAVLHLDEKTPHLHVDYIPVAHGYKSGMQCRNSLDKALKEQGVDGLSSRHGNSTVNWQEKEKEALAKALPEGLERAPETGLHRKHQTVDQYKSMAAIINSEVEHLPAEIESKPTKLSKDKAVVSQEALEALERRAKLAKVGLDVQNGLEASQRLRDAQISDLMTKVMEIAENTEKDAQEAQKRLEEAEALYQHQIGLNKKNADLRAELSIRDMEIADLRKENNQLRSVVKELREKIQTEVSKAWEVVRQSMQAVGCLIWGTPLLRKKLSPEQEDLIEGVYDWVCYQADYAGHADDVTRPMEQECYISDEILAHTELLKDIDLEADTEPDLGDDSLLIF